MPQIRKLAMLPILSSMCWMASGWHSSPVLGLPVNSVMPGQYIPILIYALLAASFPAVSLILFKYIRPDMKTTGARLEPYECGVPPEGSFARALLRALLYCRDSIRHF